MLERIRNQITDLRKEEERRFTYELECSFDKEHSIEYSEWINTIRDISDRDKIKIYLVSEGEDTLHLDENMEDEYIQFLDSLDDDEIVDVNLTIDKKIVNGYLSIYCFEKFAEDINSLPIDKALNVFSGFMKEAGNAMVFELFDCRDIFYTKTMFFLAAGSRTLSSTFDRTKRLSECRENAYFYNQDNYELLPDDFKIEVGYEGNPLGELFLKLETILASCLLASNSFIQDGNLKLQIMGQRSVEYNDALENIQGNNNLYKIYDWMYSGGNIIDKAIIARNIICLHCKYEVLLNIGSEVMSSIQTNYNLYLKDNVTQYLELKNKVAEFISDIVSRTGEYATEMLDKFKANLLAIFGFLFSVILANIVSDQPLDNIFTRDITIISEIVLGASFVYLFISYLQSKCELQKVYDSYDKLKEGMTVMVTSWNTGNSYEATITSIGNSPVESMKSSENPNMSYYPFTAVVEKDADLSSGEGVSISVDGLSGDSGNSIYLEQMFIREGGNRSYVYKKGKHGRLEKQYVEVGKNMYGSIEIVSGLTMEDEIAFPYGRNVKEGAKTKTVESLYDYN